MIIECPDCNKKFDIDQNLIPVDGRLLQCGACNYKWFFKLNIVEQQNEEELKIKPKPDLKINDDSKDQPKKNEINTEVEKISTLINKKQNKINYLNILLVIIISLISFILVLDTFKDQLTSIFPNTNFLLDNLYESLEDIKLFILDLIK
tara:strand:- start:608 stop:1054 length:447 start_codon:yes stop_codon:yes gene_type:complete